MAKSIIFVLGMHRSGTSLVTKALNVVGAQLGSSLIPPAEDNPKGFFEDEDCFRLNEAILKQLNLRWDIPVLLSEQDLSDQILKPFIKDAAYLLKTRLQTTDVFALKDPRLCLLAPVWTTAARQADLQTSFVVTVRHPLDVAHSLWKRNQFDYQKGLDLWLSHYYSLTDFLIKGQSKRIVTSYENMLSQPDKELERLTRFVGNNVKTNNRQHSIEDFAINFVDSGLAHSHTESAEIDEPIVLAQQHNELYELLHGFSNSRWSIQKARKVIQAIDPFELQAGFYRNQLKYFNKDIHQALGRQYHELEERFKQEYSQASEYRVIAEQKQQYIDQQRESLQQLSEIIEQKEQYIEEIREQSDQLLRNRDVIIRNNQRELFYCERRIVQLAEENSRFTQQADESCQQLKTAKQRTDDLQALQQQTDQHLQGALTRIDDLQKSLSYQAGRVMTLPIRAPYDALVEPLRRRPDNLRLIVQLALHAIRHPIKSAQLMRWEVIRNAYITFFKDPDIAGHVVDHYVQLFEGTDYQPATREDTRSESGHASPDTVYTEPDRVSIFVVNYNGCQHLEDLLTSLQAQDYDDFEIIVVDNGSTDGSVDFIHQQFPDIKVIALKENTGFAEANNIASEVASGRYYCLLNNDTEVASNWLSSLVNCIEKSDTTGAVGSKILFWKKFVRVELSLQPASLKRQVFLNQDLLESAMPAYRKLFFSTGWNAETVVDNKKVRRFDKLASFWFPICEGQTTLQLGFYISSKKPVKLNINTSVDKQADVVLKPNSWTELTLDLSDKQNHRGLNYLINNAGSQVDKSGQVCDRGFGVPDEGQFNAVETVTALCGGAMLIRPETLASNPVFGKEFFAYFEDTDLSLRIREQGYDLVYCPDSIVYHKHASTSKENSAFFRFYVNRNRILFLALHYPHQIWKTAWESAQSDLNHLQHYLPEHSDDPEELQFARQIPEIFNDWQTLLPRIENNTFFKRHDRFPKLAVYNNFWHTLGGGEHHACVVAQALQSLGPVDLVSENDFSIEQLEQQFDIKLKHCRKRLVSAQEIHHDPAVTEHYDIFVNSTYSSNLVSHARHSYYIVSFPYRIPAYPVEGRAFLDSYDLFLANSRYTAGWVNQWWEVDNCKVLYPSIAIPELPDPLDKSTNILHVGRFFRSGHNKKQLELVQIFKHLLDSGKVEKNWTLTLVGQVDTTQQAYLDEVLEEAQGYPIKILNNISFDQLKKLYLDSAIYWHATGLGENTERHPERNEHFGISTVEAMSYGCVPIVINAGGQPETVIHGENGFLFDNERELEELTLRCIELLNCKPEQYTKMSRNAARKASEFSRSNTKQAFLDYISDVVFHWYSDYKLL